jgi:4-hydroxybenzoate polyprenyltransferase
LECQDNGLQAYSNYTNGLFPGGAIPVNQNAASHLLSDQVAVTHAGDLPGIVLERDLILSGTRLEMLALTLRQSPLAALTYFMGRTGETSRLPFSPDALRYDHVQVSALRERIAKGQSVEINSALPSAWKADILAHLGLTPETAAKASQTPPPSQCMARAGLLAYAKALRLQQWSKNVLVFVPVVMSHQFLETQPMMNAILAFLCFGLVASSIYLMNDVMDLHQDRKHPSKRHRPFASGAIPVSHGLLLFPLLVGLALYLASLLPPMFAVTMAIYFTLNLGYTFYLKRKLLVDVLALSGCYTLRILAGNAAGPIEISNWLLAFSMFLFLSLALVKRYVELDTVETEQPDEKRVMGRGYRKGDLDMLSQLGVASGFAAVIVLALFVEGAGKSGLYKHRELIWLVCPIVLYVIGRIWVLAKRRELPDDPIFFIITDWRSHLMGGIVAFIFFMAI